VESGVVVIPTCVVRMSLYRDVRFHPAKKKLNLIFQAEFSRFFFVFRGGYSKCIGGYHFIKSKIQANPESIISDHELFSDGGAKT